MSAESAGVLFQTDSKGRVLPTATNVYRALSLHHDWTGVLRRNELADADEYHSEQEDPLGFNNRKPLPVTDEMLFQMRMWLEGAISWSKAPNKDLIMDAVAAVASKAGYHPVADYLAPLAAEWDGTPRIDHWLKDFCEADGSEYVSAVGAKFLIGACARVFQPGCKLDTMPILIGRQGVKKSTLIREMGKGWTVDTPIRVGSKDAYEVIRGAWLVEFPELAGMSGKDVETLKSFFSSPSDTYRPPYGRKPIVRPRSSAFIGTTNSADFLRDSTGSRRFLCVQVGEIAIDALRPVVDQLWAEASLRYMQGEPWWLQNGQAEAAESTAEAFMSHDPWETTIEHQIGLYGLTAVHTAEVYDWLDIPVKDRHAGTAQRIVRIFCGRLGWERPSSPFVREGRKARGFKKPGTAEGPEEQSDGTDSF